MKCGSLVLQIIVVCFIFFLHNEVHIFVWIVALAQRMRFVANPLFQSTCYMLAVGSALHDVLYFDLNSVSVMLFSKRR
jgi:hypothetical protein